MIEFKTLIGLILKSKRTIIIFLAAGSFLGWINFVVMKPDALAIVSLGHNGVNEENYISSYQYDGYYLIETSRLFSERLGQILRDPNLNIDYKNIEGGPISIKRIERVTSGDYKITVKGDPALLDEYAQNIEQKINDKLDSFAKDAGEYAAFSAQISNFDLAQQVPLFNQFAAGFLLGFLCAIMFILLRFYLFNDEKL